MTLPPQRPLTRGAVDLIVSDLDGTLLDARRQVADRTIEALNDAARAGLTIVAATGRSHWTAVPRLRPTGVVRWAVCSNGSSVYDLETDAVIDRSLLSPDACAAIAKLPELLPGAGLAWELADGVHHDRGFVQTRRALGLTLNAEEPAHALQSDAQINKVMVGHHELGHDELLAAVRPLLPSDLEITSAGVTFIEITAPGVEKGATLGRLADRLGLSGERAMAFGDQLNDLGMLRWAAYGHAMANAHPTVLASTPLRAPHHDDHGVAQVIESLLRS